MRKYLITSIAVLAASLSAALFGATLGGLRLSVNVFDFRPLADTLRDLGLIMAVLSGIALVACVVASAVRGDKNGKDDK